MRRLHRLTLVPVLALAWSGLLLASAPPAQADPPDLNLCPWMDTSLTADQRADLLLDNSTLGQTMRWLNEQASNLPNQTTWSGGVTYEAALPCTPTVYYTDGPEGVRHAGATTFPSQLGLAATWDEDLALAKGDAQGAESYALGYNGVLAPGVASGRTPLSGRTPEYLGEDSLLSGLMAGQQLIGLQQNPVITSLKHYVANEQELRRNSSSSNMTERALHEVYSLPFEIAIERGNPSSVMCSYNRINGDWACENSILNEILKDEFDYQGFVMSDFGAVHSTTASLVNGLDLELNRPRYFSPDNLNAALAAGEISQDQIEAAARRVVRAYIEAGLFDNPLSSPVSTDASTAEHKATARQIAEQGTVLLKNQSDTLPLGSGALQVAVIGSVAADASEYAGPLPNAKATCSASNNNSNVMLCTDLVSPLTSIRQRVEANGGQVSFDAGADLSQAAALAGAADVAIVFGYTRMGEFTDPADLSLAGGGDALIQAVAAAAARTVVVLETGSATEMPWLDQVEAVLEAWYPGEQAGPALAGLLFGDVNPSGKLPMTFPASLAQTPLGTTAQYPGLESTTQAACASSAPSGSTCQVDYSEDLAVGYKWYDQNQVAPLFEFGFGLSYTSFEYTALAVHPVTNRVTGQAELRVSFDVTNSGLVAGAETPQVYLTLPAASDTPGKRLVAFDRIELEPGQSQTVTVTIDSESSDHPLSVWDEASDQWELVQGDYVVSVGASSRDLRLTNQTLVDFDAAPDLTICPWMDTTLTYAQRADLLLDNSTLGQTMRWLNEQAANLPDQTVWTGGGWGAPATTTVYEAAPPCTPTVYYTDGPEGVRHDGATTFPAQIGLAATWDTDLAQAKGDAQGEESYALGYNGVLAPGVASGRTPLSGRTPEYLGEDSLLSGLMAGQQLVGLQQNPVITSLKHYVANEQEARRNSSSSNLTERALHEVYSLPFEIAIDQGQPSSVMCSYNQIDGAWACENSILNQVLKDDIGFDGFVMSDFGAVHSTTASLVNGLDLELNAPSYFSPDNLNAALAAGEITEEQIRAAAHRVAQAYIEAGLFDNPLPSPVSTDASTAEHKATARQIAEQGTVLLKNQSATLPLSATTGLKVAVIGSVAADASEYAGPLPNAQATCSASGFGSGVMPCTDLVSPLTSIRQRVEAAGGQVSFNDGADPVQAAQQAAAADVAIVFGYLRMGEFADAASLSLENGGDALIQAVADAAGRTVVVLETGSATDMPWLDGVEAVLEAWYPGEQAGPALAGLLFGDVSPSGKLPMTFPVSLQQSPTSTTAQYPGLEPDGQVCDLGSPFGGAATICQVDYSEDLAVGYKWYDQNQVAPLFEFGFGLSYTSFDYADLSLALSPDPDQGLAQLTVSFTVTNTGSAPAAEVPQVYLTLPEASATPGRRLVGFDRIELAPGQSQTVTVTIDSATSDHPLSVWDVDQDAWTVVGGAYEVAVGASSRDLRLSGQVQVDLTPAEPGALAELNDLVERSDSLRASDYTAESWSALQAARAQAAALLSAQLPTAGAVAAAAAVLQAALAGLVPADAGGLPGTGAELSPVWWGLAAGVFLVGGICLILYDRRERLGRPTV